MKGMMEDCTEEREGGKNRMGRECIQREGMGKEASLYMKSNEKWKIVLEGMEGEVTPREECINNNM